MASVSQWIEGARPRTLPNAIAPVFAGTGAAASLDGAVWWKALLALVVSLALIVGVNFANDYSDGIRGTDDERVGPLRLVGSGLASPASVKGAAMGCFAVAAVAGIALALVSAVVADPRRRGVHPRAWYYTGGKKPYGYSGFGEIAVFVFFGLVAVLGTQFVQAGRVDWWDCSRRSRSARTRARCWSRTTPRYPHRHRIREDHARSQTRRRPDPALHLVLLVVPFVVTLALVPRTPWALVGLLALPLAVKANAPCAAAAAAPH
ncbi:1,4-dihydroxy-2-naphthoate octaprenyltransferase [Rhodococcus hoagii]|nr:1,4-dihydroxy-2-naphthoate octaprenyltransferase [Prescottella equi]